MKLRSLFLCLAAVSVHGQTVLPTPTAITVTANPITGQLRAPENFFSGNTVSLITTLSSRRWPAFVVGANDLPTWTGASFVTDSIEIVNRNTTVTSSSPTLAFHRYGSGGPQFRLDPTGTNVLYLESANANSARQPTATGAFYLARFQVAAPVQATAFIGSTGSNLNQARFGNTAVMPPMSADGTTGVLDVYAGTIFGIRVHSENSNGITASSTNGQAGKFIQGGTGTHSTVPVVRIWRSNASAGVTSPLIQINDAATVATGGPALSVEKAGVSILEVDNAGRLILRAANGTRWRVEISTTGTLTTTRVQ